MENRIRSEPVQVPDDADSYPPPEVNNPPIVNTTRTALSPTCNPPTFRGRSPHQGRPLYDRIPVTPGFSLDPAGEGINQEEDNTRKNLQDWTYGEPQVILSDQNTSPRN